MEDWEKELEDIIYDMVHNNEKQGIIKLKNYFQKERVIAKIEENNQWIEYFLLEQNSNIQPENMLDCFKAMNMKYESLLTRFPC